MQFFQFQNSNLYDFRQTVKHGNTHRNTRLPTHRRSPYTVQIMRRTKLSTTRYTLLNTNDCHRLVLSYLLTHYYSSRVCTMDRFGCWNKQPEDITRTQLKLKKKPKIRSSICSFSFTLCLHFSTQTTVSVFCTTCKLPVLVGLSISGRSN